MALVEDILRLPTDKLPAGCELRLYSMRMCPYAQRSRLLLARKGVKYNCVNIDLNNKPDWFFDLNPYGEVPVIVHKGSNVYESVICAEYIENAFPTPVLYSKDAVKRAWETIYFNHWTKKGVPAFYSLLKSAGAVPELLTKFDEQIAIMDAYLKKAGTGYFYGSAPGFSDYMIWPWFERLPMLEDITGYKLLNMKYPNIATWMKQMLQDQAVKDCLATPDMMVEHYAKYRTGKPDFTIGANVSMNQETEALENLDGMRDPKTRFRKSDVKESC